MDSLLLSVAGAGLLILAMLMRFRWGGRHCPNADLLSDAIERYACGSDDGF